MDDIRLQFPFFWKEDADEWTKYVQVSLDLKEDYEPGDITTLFSRADRMPRLEVTRKSNKYMLVMNNKLVIAAKAYGEVVFEADANFISFLEIRYLEKRGWHIGLQVSSTAFLEDVKCDATEERCNFLKTKLAAKVSKMVFPFDQDHYHKT